HVAIFDAVMDRLDEVPSAALSEVSAAALTVELGGDIRQHRLGVVPLFLGAADHNRRAMARAFFTAGYASTQVADALGLKIVKAALRIGEQRIAAFDDRIALFQMRQQLLDHVVDRLPSLDHDDDGARTLYGLD